MKTYFKRWTICFAISPKIGVPYVQEGSHNLKHVTDSNTSHIQVKGHKNLNLLHHHIASKSNVTQNALCYQKLKVCIATNILRMITEFYTFTLIDFVCRGCE